MSDPIGDLKRELLAASERDLAPQTQRAHRRRNRILVTASVLPAALAVSLFVTALWKSSPVFLERAQAAITPPAGMILHTKFEVTRTSRDYDCAVTLGPNELWADLSTPHRYRIIEHNWPSPNAVDRRSMACDGNMTNESGGTPNGSLEFVAPDRLESRGPGLVGSKDQVSFLRQALATGRARLDGHSEVDGRSVERIRIDCSSPRCAGPPDYFYVDRETFLPVRFECRNCMHFSERFGLLDFDVVEHYLTYEYLPRTAANLALTDIRAQHANATER